MFKFISIHILIIILYFNRELINSFLYIISKILVNVVLMILLNAIEENIITLTFNNQNLKKDIKIIINIQIEIKL